jgi:hypothetical protein
VPSHPRANLLHPDIEPAVLYTAYVATPAVYFVAVCRYASLEDERGEVVARDVIERLPLFRRVRAREPDLVLPLRAIEDDERTPSFTRTTRPS